MDYLIINKNKTPLSATHFGGGWNLREDFPCSNNLYIVFKTEESAKEKLEKMLKTAEEQRERWGDYTDEAIGFIKTLRVAKRITKLT